MSKSLLKQLLLWMTLMFALGAHAADLPATLYMVQSSFSSTGLATADGADGVYEFSVTYPVSASTAPRYYVFTSTKKSTDAKKGTYLVYGAATIADGSNIDPVVGVAYPLVDLSSADDATALISNAKCSAFVPVYYSGATFKITVNLNDMTVIFNLDPQEDPVTSLGIFNKSTTNALATADVDTDGKARFSANFSAETIVYFAANVSKRADTPKQPIWGASSQTSQQNVTVATGETYPLVRTTYVQTYTNQKCSFVIPAGKYDITADINTGTVEFSEYTGKYRAKPATLYMRANTFSTTYASATGESGVYKFTFNKNTSTTAAPFYAVFTDGTSLATARTSSWVLGSTTDDTNVTPEYGKKYPLVDIDPDKTNSGKVGTFMPLYPQNYEVVVDLNELTVAFNPTLEYDDLSTINILSDAFALVGFATADADGIYRYGFRGAAGTKIFFSTVTDKTSSAKTNARHFGAGGHENAANVTTEVGGNYLATPISYYRVYNKLGFLELPGKCDIEFNPATGRVDIKPYTGKYNTFPETLYLRINTFSSTTYGTAEGHDGIYKFDYTTQSYGSNPRKLIFTDATSYSKVTPGSWVLGSSAEGKIVSTIPGEVTPLYDIDASDPYSNDCGYFLPFYPYTYTITVDLNNYTVTWGDEPVTLPDGLNLIDNHFGLLSDAVGGDNGVYTFDAYSYSSHPVFFTTALNSTQLRTTPWTFYSQPYNVAENVEIADGVSSEAYHGVYYQWNYSNNGYWITPEGCNHLQGTLDTSTNTVSWTVSPLTVRSPEVLYIIGNDHATIARCVGDDSGIFDFEFTLPDAAGIAFSDDKEGIMANGRMFYGSSVPYDTNRIPPVSGRDYTLYITSPEGISSDAVTFYLAKGTWKAHIDLNAMTVKFTDVSLGGEWYTPQSLNLCDDDLNVIASCAEAAEGIFTFTGVKVGAADATAPVKIVFADAAPSGSLFGSNASGEIGPTAVSGTTYNLFIPKDIWVTVDGASCFSLAPSTYDITVDFNNRTVLFFDPSVPVYPASMQLLATETEADPTVLATATGAAGVYRFSLRNTEGARDICFAVPGAETPLYYVAADPTAQVADGAVLTVTEAAAPVALNIPEGLWALELSLVDNTLKFVETVRPRFVRTTMPAGSTFPSYFGVGYNPKATFTFNNNISSIAGVWVVIGDYAGGVPAEGETTALGLRTASLADNDLIINFAGQRYALPEGAEPKVHIVLSTVKDANGELLVSEPLEGLPEGSIVFEYPYEEFARIAIDAQFDIEDEGNIDNVADINARISHFDKISFSGIVFTREIPAAEEELLNETAEEGTGEEEPSEEQPEHPAVEIEKIPAIWHAGATDADGYTAVTIEIPMSVRGMGKLTLMLDGLDIDDGFDDHAADISRSFVTDTEPTVLVTSTPDDGSVNAQITEVAISWTHSVISSVGNLASKATLTDTGTGRSYDLTYGYPTDDRTLVLMPSGPITDAGTYELVIPAGDLVFNDRKADVNKEIKLQFSVDGTMGITDLTISDDTEVEVVTLSGIVLRRGTGKSTLRGLKGIYIVNGVKCNL